jgi:hypothetical protein
MPVRESERRREGARDRYDPDLARVMTLAEFCRRNRISKITLWRLRRVGFGPRTVSLGVRRIGITYQAEREWQENSGIVRESPDRHPLTGEAWHAAHRKKRKRRAQAQASAESGTESRVR